MFFRSAPSARIAPVQAQHAIRIPVAVCDPAAKKPCLARERRSGESFLLAFEEAKQFVAQLVRHLFIRVELQNPRLRSVASHEVLLLAKALPFMAVDYRPVLAGNFLGAVVHLLVEHNDDFGGPFSDAGQRPADPYRLGAGNEADGNGKTGHGSGSFSAWRTITFSTRPMFSGFIRGAESTISLRH